MKFRTIDENRGARRAADLRRRFRQVSNRSMKRPQFGLRPGPQAPGWREAGTRKARLNDFLVWCALGAVAVFFGFILF